MPVVYRAYGAALAFRVDGVAPDFFRDKAILREIEAFAKRIGARAAPKAKKSALRGKGGR